MHGSGDGDCCRIRKGCRFPSKPKESFARCRGYLAETGYNFQLHATQDQTARQLFDVLEEVHAGDAVCRASASFLPHLEDATPETLARIKNLGGGIAVQDRLALTGERNVELWGLEKARHAPPLRTMIAAGMPSAPARTGFAAANYSPMLSLLVVGHRVRQWRARRFAMPSQNVTRAEALRMYTIGQRLADLATKGAKARSKSASSPTWRCSTRITSPCRRSRFVRWSRC